MEDCWLLLDGVLILQIRENRDRSIPQSLVKVHRFIAAIVILCLAIHCADFMAMFKLYAYAIPEGALYRAN